jgi:ADP-ribose pyrophosphatase
LAAAEPLIFHTTEVSFMDNRSQRSPTSPPPRTACTPIAATDANDSRPRLPSGHRSHGPWQIKSSRTAYQDPWISVRRDEVIRPDGTDGSYATVCIKPGVCVVAIDDRGCVHLTQEFHYAVGRTTIEGVSGGIEPGDTALETAHRELIEELGITARNMVSLGTTDPFTASVNSPTALFVASGLSHGLSRPEATELIHPVVMPLREAVQAVISGTITHAPTCIVLLRLALEQPLATSH